MPGRNAKPIGLQLLEGNPNRLTKEEIENRKASEIKLGSDKFTAPDFIKEDHLAFMKWKALVKEYNLAKDKGIDLVSSTDAGLLARYCKTYSEYRSLVEHRKNIENIEYLDSEALELLEEETSETRAKILFNKMNYIISVDGVLKLETAINKKQDMLIKMEDRLFLTPLSKIKNVGRPLEVKEVDPVGSKFGAV